MVLRVIDLEKFRILYLISGVLFLIISVTGGAWWELVGGEVSKPVLYMGLSPFGFKAELLGSQIIKPSPLMIALFVSERLLAILGSATIIAGSLLHGKTWSRRLLNLRPLTMPIGFGVTILISVIAITSLITRFVPLIAQVFPDLREALMPYSSQYLTLNLHPLMQVDGFVKISITSRFTIQFWLALLSGAFCLTGMVMRKRETKLQPPPPPPL
ncbi:MAG: hypothetical protein FGF51_06340 [Candidatus Brockarchaeota archaeon]|nr:hypothetical protein [Candidatus Brockarchaeota archaeon]